jgi:hypothetical protein
MRQTLPHRSFKVYAIVKKLLSLRVLPLMHMCFAQTQLSAQIGMGFGQRRLINGTSQISGAADELGNDEDPAVAVCVSRVVVTGAVKPRTLESTLEACRLSVDVVDAVSVKVGENTRLAWSGSMSTENDAMSEKTLEDAAEDDELDSLEVEAEVVVLAGVEPDDWDVVDVVVCEVLLCSVDVVDAEVDCPGEVEACEVVPSSFEVVLW